MTTETTRLRCFRINEADCWAGRTAEEAIADYMANHGLPRSEAVDEDFFGELPRSTPVKCVDEGPNLTVGEILAMMDGPGFVCGTEL